MSIHILERTQLISAPITEVWAFFSTPENLDTLTPQNMGFKILSPRPIPKAFEGQLIEYKVRPVLNMPLYWKTKITSVIEGDSFVDEQLKGPYSLWRHTHQFIEQGNQVLMKDRIEYKLPFGLLGDVVNKLYVKNRLKDIFDFRYKKTEELFSK